ncbi:Rrf2 family transcriptional regulator [Salmonella enterica subsp. enterica]|nr:Rrf2 family transcriptional regulator [Salmonella enterica subsp. enterica]
MSVYTVGEGGNMPALRRARKTVLERGTAVWVWQQKRPVSIAEIAGQFGISLYVARKVVHNLMRRADGLRCRLETVRGINSAGHRGLVKYFSVQYIPKGYHPGAEEVRQEGGGVLPPCSTSFNIDEERFLRVLRNEPVNEIV